MGVPVALQIVPAGNSCPPLLLLVDIAPLPEVEWLPALVLLPPAPDPVEVALGPLAPQPDRDGAAHASATKHAATATGEGFIGIFSRERRMGEGHVCGAAPSRPDRRTRSAQVGGLRSYQRAVSKEGAARLRRDP